MISRALAIAPSHGKEGRNDWKDPVTDKAGTPAPHPPFSSVVLYLLFFFFLLLLFPLNSLSLLFIVVVPRCFISSFAVWFLRASFSTIAF